MPRGGAITLGSLIRLATPFGLNERLVRTAAARLAQAGWLEARRAGRLAEYRLSGSGRERFADATKRIYGDAAAIWSGRWSLIVLPALPAAERRRLRKELAWHGFGELLNGVYAHPLVDAQLLRSQLRAARIPPRALVFDADLTDEAAAPRLVSVGWDLEELARHYRHFARRFERAAAALRRRRPEPETAFVLRTLLIHEYRRLHLRDPLLPPRLLAPDWPGTRAAELCREIYGRVFDHSEEFLSSIAARLEGALPPADPQLAMRFVGRSPRFL
jgi:phenylacetic acid degradation operon negative regulatory protein